MVENPQFAPQDPTEAEVEAFFQSHPGKSVLERRQKVEEVLNALTSREKSVLKFRFFDGRPRTQAQVGELIGRSRWTVGRIERGALEKLRYPDPQK